MKITKTAAFALLGLASSFTLAETAQEAAIKKAIEPKLGENTKVDSVVQTPYAGLFEVRAAGEIYYTDEKARYLIVGHVFDTSNQRDITK
jgi:thiol:disulfide interchange protein DsbC